MVNGLLTLKAKSTGPIIREPMTAQGIRGPNTNLAERARNET
jgi:hypothetical protein